MPNLERLAELEHKTIGMSLRIEGEKPHPALILQAMILILECIVAILNYIRIEDDTKETKYMAKRDRQETEL